MTSSLFGQTYTDSQDSLFQHLDKNKIPTGVLYERVYPWAELDMEKENDFTPSYSFIKQAWLELYLASYINETFISIDEVKDKILTNKLEGKPISLGFIDFKFNTIDTQAISNGSLYIGEEDSLLYDGEGNPYLEHEISYPLVSTETLNGDYAAFYFDSSIYLSNRNRDLIYMHITLSNGKNKIFYPGDFDSLFIGDINDSLITGTIDLHFSTLREPISNDLIWYNGNYITFNYQFNENKCYTEDSLWTGLGLKFKGYDENSASQGFGNYRIFYRKINNSWSVCADNIQKPIIIIDGFDPGNEREIVKVDNKDGIWDEFKFGNNQHLGDSLRSLGYDVIVLNFPIYKTLENGTIRDGGADYIERNAMVLVRLIQKVNEELTLSNSEEELVIIGPSMGGQIARYALTYMEEQDGLGKPNMNHNTRLYVSFDSPHLGANVPVGMQSAIGYSGHIRNDESALDIFNVSLRSTAAKQMLIHQVEYNAIEKNIEQSLGEWRTQWDNTLNTIGYPMNLRKVALINGTLDGAAYSGCNTSLDYKVKKNSFPFEGSLLFYMKLKNIAGNDNANPNGEFCEVFYAYERGSITKRLNYNNKTVYGNLDVVPGGQYNIPEQIKNKLDFGVFYTKKKYFGSKVFGYGKLEKYIGDYSSFIPSVSALGFYVKEFNWADPINRDLICNNEIPFDNYFAAEENEEHIHISSKAAAWILEEIEKGQVDCPQLCLSIGLVENDLKTPLCVGEERYVVHNFDVPSGSNVEWYLDSSNYSLEIVNYDDYKVKIKGKEADKDIAIYCKISNPCGADWLKTFTLKQVGVFPGGLTILPDTNSNVNNPPTYNFAKIEFYDTLLNDYYWKKGENGNWLKAGSRYYGSFQIHDMNNPNYNKLYLKTVNECDSIIEEAYPHFPSGFVNMQIELPEVQIQPNPSANNWMVYFSNNENRRMALYDITGRKLWSIEKSSFEMEVPGDKLSDGIYILKIEFANGAEETYKLLKQ